MPSGSLGWDIVITPQGPLVLEANANWGADIMQMGWGGLGKTEIGRRAHAHWLTRKSGTLSPAT